MAEEMLRIGRDSQFYLQGNLISTKEIENINDYLVQLLAFNTTLEEGITLSELIHALYGMSKFIGDYFSEEYEVARAFATSTKLDRKMSNITFYKSFRLESDNFMDDDEYVYILPEIKLEESDGDDIGYLKIGALPIVIDDNLIFKGEDFCFEKKTKFTLLDIMTCIFEEVIYFVREGKGIEV
jgi:hypothetical protein